MENKQKLTGEIQGKGRREDPVKTKQTLRNLVLNGGEKRREETAGKRKTVPGQELPTPRRDRPRSVERKTGNGEKAGEKR